MIISLRDYSLVVVPVVGCGYLAFAGYVYFLRIVISSMLGDSHQRLEIVLGGHKPDLLEAYSNWYAQASDQEQLAVNTFMDIMDVNLAAATTLMMILTIYAIQFREDLRNWISTLSIDVR